MTDYFALAVNITRQHAEDLAASVRPGPDPEWVRGECPRCSAPVISNSYYVGGNGYCVVWECWKSLGEHPTCDYRKLL